MGVYEQGPNTMGCEDVSGLVWTPLPPFHGENRGSIPLGRANWRKLKNRKHPAYMRALEAFRQPLG